MIRAENGRFILNTSNTSYIFYVNKDNLLEHMHYGGLISMPETEEAKDELFRAVSEKISHGKGTSICYTKDSMTVTEDMLLEVSGAGKGDFREPFVMLTHSDGSRTCDFVYDSFEILKEFETPKGLPGSYPGEGGDTICQLKVVLKEKEKPVKLNLIYTVFPECDVITRRAELVNEGNEKVYINRIMSTQVDFDNNDYKMITFTGNWGREMDKTETVVEHGMFVNHSTTGFSSNRNNPFVMLTETEAGETHGECYGFNLIYSGNHYEACEVGGFYKTRFVSGIDPTDFGWTLEAGERFATPEAIMTFSDKGYRGISLNMHSFIKEHIVRGRFKNAKRPILLNSWEASYFNISESGLVSLAKKAKEAGMELFVMDDGWFKGRNGEKSSLGDWVVDEKKLPGGIKRLSGKIHDLGLEFGIWVEPEMVNEVSDLFRAHPEYAMQIPGRENALGRYQMLLDLTNPEVVEYVKNSMRNVFKDNGIDYVKWDMNRLFSDVYSHTLPAEKQKETAHRWMLGLYDIMSTITAEFPDILFEGCASGGNRFDPGILCFFPQIWASDDTDAMMRTRIQTGYSYGYPMSVVTSHVSACPNHQTLRNTPLDTRFNIAAFGLLGYELNLCDIKSEEFEEIKKQVETYKEWRDVFKDGEFYRVGKDQWMVVSNDKKRAVSVVWNELVQPNDFYRKLRTVGLDNETTYHVYNIRLKHNLKVFGDLVNQVAPIHVKQDSLIHNTLARFIKMDGESEDYLVKGDILNNAGIKLCQAFGGTGFNDETRVFQDFASRMYFFEAVE